ncbi:hypothetical protein FRB95_009027 [Tulasnella sp. JGI-2019a]|nr:hypothetical protein FRB95_009027 [Tulasnella sp. JGI-2019a]
MSRKELEVAIQRSKRTPLHIHFKGPAQYSFARKSFVELIMPHMARWKTLIGENVPQSVIEGLESGAPSLLNLQLKSSTGPQMVFTAMQTVSQTASPALGDGARLVSLDLTAIGMSWTSARLQGLKHLALFTLYGEKAPNIADMVYILAHSPHLEVLILHDVAFTPSQASLGIQQNMETLTPFLSLQRLQLTMIPSRYYYHLLTHLRFPNCKSIDLAPNPPLNPVEDDQVTYRHNTPLFAQQIRSMLLCDGDGPVQVGLGYLGDPKTFHLSTFGRRVYPMNIPRQPDRPGFSLRLRPPTTMDEMGSLEVVQEVIELVLQACPASALHLSICLTSTVPQFPIECLARLNNTNSVEELSVSGSADVRSILQYIAQRREPLTTTSERELFSTWLFPQLKTISLAASSCNNSVVAIRDWAKERWMKSNTKWPRPEGSVEVTMPSRKGGRQEFWKPVVRRRVTGRQAVAELEDGEDEDES